MAAGDTGGQIRFLELIGRGFEEVNRHAEALRFFERAIKLANSEKDSGCPQLVRQEFGRHWTVLLNQRDVPTPHFGCREK
jgi:hypothetical protein